MKKSTFAIILFIVLMFIVVNKARANEKEANIYMQEQKLHFGDEVCYKVILKYAFADCYFNDLSKNEPFFFDDKRTLEFGDLKREKCLKLYNERVKCYWKNKAKKDEK